LIQEEMVSFLVLFARICILDRFEEILV
jgi:hypothetical protein